MTKMFLYSHLLQVFIVLVSSSSSCFSNTLEDKLFINHDQPHSLKPIAPNSAILGNSKSNFARLMKYDTESFDLPRLSDQVGVPTKMVNVDDFGAKGDGTDDSEAFREAWREVCACEDGVLLVPKNRIYHLKPINFSGPCNSKIAMKIDGTIKASIHRSDYKHNPTQWLLFENIHNFEVEGGGTINGNGKIWWKYSCKINKSRPCMDAPTAATFNGCKNLRVSGLRVRNSQQIHISFQKCVNVEAWNLKIVAPRKSPNTDGIHVTGTQNIQIKSSVIRTGDDCISIVSGSKNVKVKDIICGPGHGISIGSLGKGNSEANVSDVSVKRAKLLGTTNGVRIKTWQGGSGYAKNIKFSDIMMHNVSNPIIIDQNYCDQPKSCPEQKSAVQVENVWYKNIRGTSASKAAIQLNCSNSFPCQGIVLQHIDLITSSQCDDPAKASCVNVRLSTRGRVSPPCSEEEEENTDKLFIHG